MKSKPKASAMPETDTIDTNIWPPLIKGLVVIVIAVGGFLLWAVKAPLDAGVVADGTVTVSNNRKTIQHLSGGRVTDIYMKEGDVVKKNQVLMRLDTLQLDMRYSALSAQYISAKTSEDRLLAERTGADHITFSPSLLKHFAGNKRLLESQQLQAKLFLTRRKNVQDEISMIEETLDGLAGQTENLNKIKGYRERQFTLINKELGAVRALSEKNYYPKAQLMVLEREAAEISSTVSEDILNIAKLKSQQNEMRIKAYQVQHQYLREVESELMLKQKEVAMLEDELQSTRHERDNTVIRSPIDGIVLDVKVSTVGGVIQPGERLMDIVAAGQPLQIDAKIPVHAIDKLAPGLTVDVLFPALNHALLPSVPARVLTVSADRLTDKVTQQPYYLAEVQVLPEGVRLLRDHKIKAGMPASVTIKTGERTFLSYLFKPLMARLEMAFKEI
ncbi:MULTISPECIES: HlyD family type I secretion periplasmic adaptor subunit [Enterobacteriaceae]|uniref:Membrane fusion protein (MFP) family protein n=2 Tax=Enterobacteriaceae TaxID=543 RepID=A0A2T2Y882_9ENTR|nr:HlyD family type I secretion periplasmic adaptor subunit [Klebsiella sp. WP8-S18-ESBL-06]PSR48745.1 HlyD family type I secretion periplasmic adaptor subunit [Kluyvera genomosp. 2]BBQ83035.1 metalloprotease secretion protein [Klebsiella sp. WP3-W18-ESBL-02]BBR20069.1 metalloprotease secretion protein [Klebsiella sp. WP3-S18-ESBL-05]BBR59704.1 metalloprotease secretion protein [Klebsiella sp. WP4-W18-ESBL-05]BBS90959.1 metalloprotease secretion protein [Klebsiella sp. WP7-S18-CRE-02]BBS95982